MDILSAMKSAADAVSLESPLSALQGEQPSPRFVLTVDGMDITSKIQGRLINLTMSDNRGFEADELEVTLDDTDGKLTLPRRGAKMRLSLGWAGARLVPKGEFTVDELEHSGAPDTLVIRGKSVDMRDGMQVKREKSYHKQTVSGIVEHIARRHNLACSISPAMAGQLIDHLDQHESDCQLLARLATQFDAIATVKNGTVLFAKAGQALTASGKQLPAVTINRQSGDSHRFSVADRDAYTGVIAYWHDHKKAEKKAVTVKRRKHKKKDATATIPTTPIDPSLPTAAANQNENELLVGSRDNVKTLRYIYANQKNAERGARAAWEKLQRGVAQFSITLAKGRPELFPELPVTVKGFKPQIDEANWLLTRVVHQLDGSGGYTNELELEVKVDELPE